MKAIRYRVEHETRYAYDAPVSQSWQRARLTPRALPWQKLLTHAIDIDPRPDERHDGPDAHGNTVTHFGIHGAHRRLRVLMHAEVEVGARTQLVAGDAQPWETVAELLRRPGAPADLDAARLTEPTALLPLSDAARCYASAELSPGRDWLEAVTGLMHGIHADFEFEAGATSVSTSVDDVLQQRRGVCQDFAHLMLAALRGHGLAARYVSGYLLTEPPPGKPRLMGVDASHAWVAAWSPRHGWVEFDPTNDQLADQRYITLAWGADFADVVPLRGVILGGGTQAMDVAVSVIPVAP
ncbi:transglutaminase family protein [uncultured Piscinibacter sp.]|uniref:transglutaminase family protein n=1 Tax=uncultured Piscinibacter sp. TaxID=1131835 RepID=UPI00261E94E1|nr:transglutaminase family protein [uncultured Piscinibacter sp.]